MYILNILLLNMLLLLMYYLIFDGISHLMRILIAINRLIMRIGAELSTGTGGMLERSLLGLMVGLLTFRTLRNLVPKLQIDSSMRIIHWICHSPSQYP